jgi:hypothetical protein
MRSLSAVIVLMISTGAFALPPGSRAPATSIIGAAWNADNTPIPNARLRLRNVVTGRAQAATVANPAGRFTFADIESGTYVVELISDAGKVLAVSHTATVGPGETIVTFVRLGSKVPWFDGFFRNAATVVSSAAASTGIVAMAPEQMQCVSPPCR